LKPPPLVDDRHTDRVANRDSRWAKPTLAGRLVALRPFVAEDLGPAWEMINDPVGNELIATSERFTFATVREWYQSRNEQQDRLDLAVVENATSEFAGEVVLSDHDPATDSCSFRISLRGPDWYGRGLGTEAASLVVAHGFDRIGLRQITLEVLARNTRAQRSYEKVGFERTGESSEDGTDWVHMTMARPPTAR
jgi:RimJ/RimL family protein N-acetyltransferase